VAAVVRPTLWVSLAVSVKVMTVEGLFITVYYSFHIHLDFSVFMSTFIQISNPHAT
jgi:hypothetical protein